MSRFMLPVFAGLLIGVCAGAEEARSCSGTDFSKMLYALPAGFKPQTTAGYVSPLSAGTGAVLLSSSNAYSAYLNALTSAFALAAQAAPMFQNHLCGLTATVR